MSKHQACIVLVHGSWHTGECWGDVVAGLREYGYQAIAPTMPGHGKNAVRSNVTFEDYRVALLDVLKTASGPTALLGHSSAGVLLQGVAPILPSHVKKLVFLNAFVLSDSVSLIDVVPPHIAKQFRAEAAMSEDNSLPVNEDFFRHVILPGVAESVRLRIMEQLVPQPFSYYTYRINYDKFTGAEVSRVFLHAVDDNSLPDEGFKKMAAGLGEFERVDIPGGHEVMYTNPDALIAGIRKII